MRWTGLGQAKAGDTPGLALATRIDSRNVNTHPPSRRPQDARERRRPQKQRIPIGLNYSQVSFL